MSSAEDADAARRAEVAAASSGGDDGQAPFVARGWLLVCGALAGGSAAAWWLPSALLDWQPAHALDQPWRFVTAAWVHWHEQHLLANLAGCAVVAWLGVAARLPSAAAGALAAAWPLTHAGLLLQPALAHYGGASGVLHAAAAVAACWLVVGRRNGALAGSGRRARLIGVAIAAGLVAKVLLEKPWGGPLAAEPAWGIAVAVAAHASGAAAGAVAALTAMAARRTLAQRQGASGLPPQ
ncbi:MAG: rhombosortase [Rubrivivax sp.]|nr:rhombosortase [Rubrivivax sp.]